MPRGPKKHLKRLNAPSHWMLDKMGGMWAPKPSAGPHKGRESLPLILCLRNRLKYALTKKEALMICMERHVQVDGKVRTDPNFPAGFMDVIELEASGDRFRILYDTKGKFVLHPITADEAKFKLCKVRDVARTKKAVPYLVTHDARTIRFPDPIIKAKDTVKIDIATGKVVGHIAFDLGTVVMITKGRNAGRVGTLVHRERHPGSFDIIQVKDHAGHTFATRLDNAFVIGASKKPDVTLPGKQGLKRSIIEELEIRRRQEKKH
jgi:ribosomal protein S4E